MRRVDEALVRVSDTSGRQRGLATPVDHQGTLLTSHEAVDGRSALLLTWPGGAVRRITADDITALPEFDLALLRTDAVLPPLPLGGGRGTRLIRLPLPAQTLQGGVAGLVTAVMDASHQPAQTTSAIVAGVIGVAFLIAGTMLTRKPQY